MTTTLRPTIYLCGPVSEREDEARDEFRRAEALLESCGYHVTNPLKHVLPGVEWHTAMHVVLKELLDCTGVALLDGWQESRGATIEKTLADDLDMPVAPLFEWVRGNRE